jgi:hypothetical protein
VTALAGKPMASVAEPAAWSTAMTGRAADR